MKITINGLAYELTEPKHGGPYSISQLIEYLQKPDNTAGLNLTDVVIACNQTFIPRGQYHNTLLNSGDTIELLSPMAGG